jgi:phosphatidylserine/phosphatidylglycerophosphate/cardiolipin synthase-like enzyme
MSDNEMQPVVQLGRNCWRIERADSAKVIVDAAAYYELLEGLMENAKERILLIGWDFDPRISLKPNENGKSPSLGQFLLRLAKEQPDRDIDILRWNFGGLKQFFSPTIVSTVLRWKMTKSIRFRLDGVHPLGCSHHQKVAVFDDHLAVCGGIDVADRRWDTPEHRDDDPRRVQPNGKPYEPWHDVTMLLAGPVGAALADLGKERWKRATKTDLHELKGEGENWPADLQPDFENVEVAISRTRAEYDGVEELREIEQLYLDMIKAAKRFIYFENQYFTSGRIAAAIAERLNEDCPPEFIMVMPEKGDGWLEQMAMDAARVVLVREISKAKHGKNFRIYVPHTKGGTPIYVHAKVAVMDDRLLRIGSANLNNRSMGLDSECDVTIDCALPANRSAVDRIKAIRETLIAEHLDVRPQQVADRYAETGSLLKVMEEFSGEGKTLEWLDLEKPGPMDEFIANNELLDPTSPDAVFESPGAHGVKSYFRRRFGYRRLK